MLFPTLDFALFFMVVFIISWELRRHFEARKIVLLAASYFFYGYWDWRFTGLLLASSLLNYGAGHLLQSHEDEGRRKLIVGIAVGINLSVLGFFKYYGFFLDSLTDILVRFNIERDLPFLEIILPVGISFFTFQGISYVVDVYRRDVKASTSLVDLCLYISFFPQLVAGPIVRASEFLPQLTATPRLSRTQMGQGVVLILVGLFKKMVIANYLATEIVDKVFFDPSAYGAVDLAVGVYAYAIQIYCDFSGYSDIAIGIAALLGYRFQRNFDQPYRARSLREFWRRWHISLSTWLRDYLYKPLGGSHGGKYATYRNIILTMVLGGIWHGAAWTFILWGVFHGVAIATERFIMQLVPQPNFALAGYGEGKVGRILELSDSGGRFIAGLAGFFLTFNLVCFSWILFRSTDMDTVFMMLQGLTNWSVGPELATPFINLLVFGTLAAQFLPGRWVDKTGIYLARLDGITLGVVMGAGLLFIEAVSPEGVAPFIYFQF
jgi:alginate O-acetyltransferase complex protein AlgI